MTSIMQNQNFNHFGVITDKNDPNYGRTACQIISRAMGFLRPVSNFNIGKYQEYKERRMFKEDKCLFKGGINGL